MVTRTILGQLGGYGVYGVIRLWAGGYGMYWVLGVVGCGMMGCVGL